MRKLRHLSLRSAAATLTGKKREKTAIGQAKYQQAFDTEQQCKRKIEELQTELGIITDKVFTCFSPLYAMRIDVWFFLPRTCPHCMNSELAWNDKWIIYGKHEKS